MNKNLLLERVAYKPFEYPEFHDATLMLRRTNWNDEELDFIQDKHDFNHKLDDKEKYIIGTILKSFAQTETQVANDFWGCLKDHIKKPEVIEMAATFTENEWRHATAYDRLSEELNLSDYSTFLENDLLVERLNNLLKISVRDNKTDAMSLAISLAVFGGFLENVCLFSQFAIMLSFSHRGLLPDTGNIIAWSQKDEAVHASMAMHLFNTLVLENNLNKQELFEIIKDAASTTFLIEKNLIDQIFEKGDLSNLKKIDLIEFMKFRINMSMLTMGFEEIFDVDHESIKNMDWFISEYSSLEMTDFFFSRPIEYTKGLQTYTSNDLF
jgi:ribonucleoside-diphosphate reductase beta chain